VQVAAAGEQSQRAGEASAEAEAARLERDDRLAEARRVASFEGRPFMVADDVTADGRRILVSYNENGQMAFVDLETGAVDWLTEADGPFDPTWVESALLSPDGDQIAYTEFDIRTDGYPLVLEGVAGDGRRTLSLDPSCYHVPVDWTADGSHLLTVCHTDGAERLVEFDVGTGEGRQLRSFGLGVRLRGVAYTPDGEWVTYRPEGMDDRIHLLSRDLDLDVPLDESTAGASIVGWSPDGRWVAFESTREGSPALFRQPFEENRLTGEPTRVQGDRWEVENVGFDARGRLFYSLESRRYGLRTIALGETRNPEADHAADRPMDQLRRPRYAPNGQSLFYLNRGLFVVESLTTGVRREFRRPVRAWEVHGVRWSPDSRSLFVPTRDRRGRNIFYRYDLATSRVDTLRVWNGSENVWGMDVTPDGRGLVFAVRSESPSGAETHRIDYLDVESGDERVIMEASERMNELAISPGGDSIAALVEGRLLMIPMAGGDTRVLLEDPRIDYPTKVAWQPSGQSLLLTPAGGSPDAPVDGAGRRVVTVDRRTGAVTDLIAGGEESAEVHGWMTVHPNGREVTFVVRDPGRTEIWVLEDVFPPSAATVGTGSADTGPAGTRGEGRTP